MPLKKPRQKLEALHQMVVVQWLRARKIWHYHVPNGTALRGGKIAGAQLKRMGVSAGVPDIIIPQPSPRRGCPCAFEMKAPGSKGRVTPEQRQWFAALEEFGWHTAVYDSAQAAILGLTELGY